jgi:hypothetical protein
MRLTCQDQRLSAGVIATSKKITCYDSAGVVIVCGCLEGHLHEMVLCYRHGIEWTEKCNRGMWYCSECSGKIIIWDDADLANLRYYYPPGGEYR